MRVLLRILGTQSKTGMHGSERKGQSRCAFQSHRSTDGIHLPVMGAMWTPRFLRFFSLAEGTHSPPIPFSKFVALGLNVSHRWRKKRLFAQGPIDLQSSGNRVAIDPIEAASSLLRLRVEVHLIITCAMN